MQLLPDRLKGWPLAPPWRGEGETDSGELLLIAQIGDRVRSDFKAPEVPRQLVFGPQCQLLDLPMPLGPGRSARVGEIEARDPWAALPTSVWWRL